MKIFRLFRTQILHIDDPGPDPDPCRISTDCFKMVPKNTRKGKRASFKMVPKIAMVPKFGVGGPASPSNLVKHQRIWDPELRR